MNSHPDCGKVDPTEGKQGARERCNKEHTESGRGAIRYKRLLHRRSASLDLEAAFKRMNISWEIIPDICRDCKKDKCQCPAFKLEMPCSSPLSMPTHSSTDSD